MPTVSRFRGVVITMYWDDHEPPHFHARHGSDEALIHIDPLEVGGGDLPPRVLRLVKTWAALHRQALLDNWPKCQARLPLDPIEGLP